MSRRTIPIRLGWLSAPALALNLFALTSLCYATPPDQTWIAGVYDDADHDDVVLEVLATCGVPPTVAPRLDAPDSIREPQPSFRRSVPHALSRTALLDRSPPLA